MTDIHPLKPVWDIPFLEPWEWGILVFIGLFVIVRCIQWLIHLWKEVQRKKIHKKDSFDSSLSFEKRIQNLEYIREQGDYKRLSHEITTIIKEFLSHKHEENMREWTTTEILEWYSEKKYEKERIEAIFQWVDPIKFARKEVQIDQSREIIEVLLIFIQDHNG